MTEHILSSRRYDDQMTILTKNAWQSLENSPPGAAVSPLASSSETKPSCQLANVQRMHVVSVCLHYGNIIWLPWQRPLTN